MSKLDLLLLYNWWATEEHLIYVLYFIFKYLFLTWDLFFVNTGCNSLLSQLIVATLDEIALENVSETNQNFMQTVSMKISVYVCGYTETVVT